MSIFLDHARHNKEAFEYLNSSAKFPDWTVTTAFYCAMHYCHAILFPLSENGNTYNDIEEYFNGTRHANDTKHGLTLALVRRLHPTIGDKYKILKDVAHTSRYQDYQIASPVVALVRRNLKIIETYCENIINPPALPPTP